MAYVLGKDLLVKEGNTAIAGATSCNVGVSSEVLNTTTKGDGDWTSNMAGLKSWNIDTDALFQVEDFAYVEKVGTEVPIEVTLGAKTYTGKAIINDLKINSGTGELVTYNLTMTGTGALAAKQA